MAAESRPQDHPQPVESARTRNVRAADLAADDLTPYCPSCQAANEHDSVYCVECGRRIGLPPGRRRRRKLWTTFV